MREMLKWQVVGKCLVARVNDSKEGWYEIEHVDGDFWCKMIRRYSNGKMGLAAMIITPTLDQAKAVAQRHWSTGIWR